MCAEKIQWDAVLEISNTDPKAVSISLMAVFIQQELTEATIFPVSS
jgi:hypothetical protein